MVIRQPGIAGSPATEDEIRGFFGASGWLPFRIDGHTAYFDPARRIVFSDTHRGYLVRMSDGLLAPIDLRVQEINGARLDAARKWCAANPRDDA